MKFAMTYFSLLFRKAKKNLKVSKKFERKILPQTKSKSQSVLHTPSKRIINKELSHQLSQQYKDNQVRKSIQLYTQGLDLTPNLGFAIAKLADTNQGSMTREQFERMLQEKVTKIKVVFQS